jgi:uncharacterized protein YceH (UPF0502 family)
MTSETQAQGLKGPWPILDMIERRVLGVLVEKAKTTPDAYPMSLNALVAGCNQKSNREPILNLSEADVEEGLTRCQKKGLVLRVISSSSRVERWRHILYETWHLDATDIAIVAELLLRGPQTEGELRGRAGRMAPIEDLDKLKTLLRGLTERNLVLYLTPEDRRGAVVTHGFHDPQEMKHLRAQHAGAAPAPVSTPMPATPAAEAPLARSAPSRAEQLLPLLETAMTETRAEIDALKRLTAELQTKLVSVTEELQRLKQSLGV